MAKIRYDKLGRRIPEFDRSAAAKKGMKTKEKLYGVDHHKRMVTAGGRVRTRGYFGKLKDEGKTDELRKLSAKAVEEKRARKIQDGDGRDTERGPKC